MIAITNDRIKFFYFFFFFFYSFYLFFFFLLEIVGIISNKRLEEYRNRKWILRIRHRRNTDHCVNLSRPNMDSLRVVSIPRFYLFLLTLFPTVIHSLRLTFLFASINREKTRENLPDSHDRYLFRSFVHLLCLSKRIFRK